MRSDIPDWNTYFMDIAEAVKRRSKDPRTQVGCVVVSLDNRILVTGYNGMPAGIEENDALWERENKHEYVLHAEMNAIAHSTHNLRDSVIYITLAPCIDCAKMIVASGIKTVYYGTWKDADYCKKAQNLLEYSKIGCYQVKPTLGVCK